jgi:hypothetical protein
MKPFRFLPVFALTLCTSAAAQSFNVDVGEDPSLGSFGVPSSTYPGAAAQPGFWNGLTDGVAGQATPAFGAGTPWWITTLNDLAGNPTTVTVSAVMSGNSVGDFVFNNASTTGDDQALYDDVGDVGGTASQATWTINGLQSGFYDVYLYAWAPDNSTYITRVSAANTSSTDPQTSGGAWPGGHLLGTTYTKHSVTVNAGTITMTITTVSGFGSNNGFQIVRTGNLTVGTGFCFGDGTGTACPCANSGTAGNGCASSVNAAGANLSATGVALVSADTVVLNGTGMPNSSALYFQGTTQVSALLGDGLRCAGGTVIRLGTKANLAGASQYPSVGDLSVSQKGLLPVAGGTRTYQVWYRNAATFCTASTFNLSNGLQIAWAP